MGTGTFFGKSGTGTYFRSAPKKVPVPNFHGFSYVEVLTALALTAIALVPAVQSLGTPAQSSAAFDAALVRRYAMSEKMEQVLGDPWSTVAAEASSPAAPSASVLYSDTAGSADRRLVYITTYDGDDADADGDPFTGTDAGLLWIRVAVENSVESLESLRAR